MALGSLQASLAQLDSLKDLDAQLLDELQRRFLMGEDWLTSLHQLPQQPRGTNFNFSFNLTPAAITSLSIYGSLKAGVGLRRNGPHALGSHYGGGSVPLPLEPAARASVQGRRFNLPGWLEEMKESSRLSNLLTTAIESGPANLMANKNGVRISSSVDFGVKRAGWPIKNATTFPYDRPPPTYFRSFTVVNDSSEQLLLVDICGIPAIDGTVLLHDDYHMAHHHDRSCINTEDSNLKAGVMLQPREEYQVTVELRCWPHDCSFHQQWLLFTFGKENLHFGSTTESTVFVIGRRISALVAKHTQDLQTCLSTEAKPFFPAVLRGLFDTPPAKFSVADPRPRLSFMECSAVPAACRRVSLLAVWPASVCQLEQVLHSELLDQDRNLSHPDSAKLPKGDDRCTLGAVETNHCFCFPPKLRQLSRLLALEEAAMDHDIKSFDLFNVHLSYYSGDLFKLEVPGLPENRPSVFVGDVVYVRWATHQIAECAAVVYAVEFIPTPKLILRLSKGFLSLVFRSTYQEEPSYVSEILQRQLVHIRFTFDRLMFKRMHGALLRVARSSLSIFPCLCIGESRKVIKNPMRFATCTDPPSSTRDRVVPASPLKLKNPCLNEEQQEAVRNVLEQVSGPSPYIIFGPPGTGKTVTVVECVLQVVARDPAARLCVCAPSNYATDILCSGIAAGGVLTSKIWRLNDPRRSIASVKTDVLPFCQYNTTLGLFEMHPNPSCLQVIVCTCGAAGFLHESPLSRDVGPFTHVFVDEAGQALIPEVLIPLSLGSENTCRVLCGDPRQLGPVVHSTFAVANGLAKSLLEILMLETHNKKGSAKSVHTVKLIRNYRANSKLLELPSRMFYDSELIAAAETDVNPPREWEELNGGDFPILFYGVKSQQMCEGESPSLFNPVEATKVADLIEGLLKASSVKVEDIGVMAPYRRQVQKVRLVLRRRGLRAVRVGTVDDYQGQEERVIFISTVLTKVEPTKTVCEHGLGPHIGFLRNEKRFNVAITRAKAMLVIIGHPLVLSQDRNWSELLRYCLARDAFRGYGSQLFPTVMRSTLFTSDLLKQESESCDSNDDDRETSRAIEKLAELSLLGMGDMDRLYPESLDSLYSANNEDLEWRVML